MIQLKPYLLVFIGKLVFQYMIFTCSRVLITSKGHVTIAPAVPPTLQKSRS
jgi:hypothetical protein